MEIEGFVFFFFVARLYVYFDFEFVVEAGIIFGGVDRERIYYIGSWLEIWKIFLFLSDNLRTCYGNTNRGDE